MAGWVGRSQLEPEAVSSFGRETQGNLLPLSWALKGSNRKSLGEAAPEWKLPDGQRGRLAGARRCFQELLFPGVSKPSWPKVATPSVGSC